ncbi:MAG: hypothetical protein K6L75_05795 [Cellvibrionaceae bacterium]
MEFSVIVETPANKISATEDCVAELERYLLSAQISPKILYAIEPGKPQILKKELSYKQAVDLSDRLMDFGLESEIHPPTKPDKENLEVPSAPKTNTAPHSKEVQNNNPTQDADTHVKLASKSNAINGNPNGAAKLSQVTPKFMSNNDSPQKTTQTTTPQVTTKPKVNLKQQAEEIKSLFKIPKLGLSNTEISALDVTKFYFTALLSLVLPALYVSGILVLAIAAISSAIIFHSLIASFSIILWVLSIILLSIPLLVLAGLLAIPFFSKDKEALKNIPLTAKDEPRLFMLTAAVCKIIGTPTPEKININFEGNILGDFSFNKKDLFKLNKSLTIQPSITICISLLNNLSIRQYCSLISRELGKQKHAKLLRPNAICNSQLKRMKKWKEKPGITSDALKAASSKISNEKAINIIAAFTSLSETTEYLHKTYFNFSHQIISKKMADNSVAARYQYNVFGAEPNEPLTLLQTKLENLAASRYEAIQMMVIENESHRYASDLASLIEHIEEKYNSGAQYKVIDDSLIPRDKALKSLINNTVKYSNYLTRDFYSQNQVDLEKAQLLSIENLLKKESRDAKIEKIAVEYFGKWHHGLQYWKLPKEAVLASIDKNHIIAVLNNCISKLRYMSPDRPALIEKYYRQLKQLTEIKAAKKIRSTGSEYKLTSIADNITNLDTEISAREAQLQDINTQLMQQNAAMGERISLGLLLDKDHKEMTSKLYTALAVLSDCASNLNNIAADCEELQTLINSSPKKINQHFNLQIKKVKDSIDENFKILSRKLKKCPYDYLDQRHEFLFGVLNENIAKADSPDANKRTLQKGKISLTTTATSYKSISDLAANYATRMERLYKIESIRKL